MTYEEYQQKLEDCGWADEMQPDQAQSFWEHLKDSFDRYYDPFELEGMVPLLSGLIIDWRVIEEREDCAEILGTLASHSGGKFQPINIGFEMDRDRATAGVSFEQQGRVFTREIPTDSDMGMQFELYRLVNEALGACAVEQRFILMPYEGQEGFLVFLSPRVYEKAVAAGLLPYQEPNGLALDPEATACLASG